MGTHGEIFKDSRRSSHSSNDFIRQLEEQALCSAESRVRKQSEREQNWIERMVIRYGDDYKKMARDQKLNPMQQTPQDIKRRILKWKAMTGNHTDQLISREDDSGC